MKVFLVAEEDGYDSYNPRAIYDNQNAAELHVLAIDELNKRPDGTPGVDFGVIEEFELLSTYELPVELQ